MNITTKTVLKYFLLVLKNHLEKTNANEIEPFFEDFFLKEELIVIVRSMYDAKDLKDIPLDNMKPYELMDMIGDNFYILDYYINQWESEMKQNKVVNPKKVCATLQQLGQQTHYLFHRPIEKWDAYDYSNYQAMLLRAGKLKRVYGIYDAMVSPDDVDKVDTPPKRFFESHEKALRALDEYISSGKFREDEIKILSTFK